MSDIARKLDAFALGALEEAAREKFRIERFLSPLRRQIYVIIGRRELLRSEIQIIEIRLPARFTLGSVLLQLEQFLRRRLADARRGAEFTVMFMFHHVMLLPTEQPMVLPCSARDHSSDRTAIARVPDNNDDGRSRMFRSCARIFPRASNPQRKTFRWSAAALLAERREALVLTGWSPAHPSALATNGSRPRRVRSNPLAGETGAQTGSFAGAYSGYTHIAGATP